VGLLDLQWILRAMHAPCMAFDPGVATFDEIEKEQRGKKMTFTHESGPNTMLRSTGASVLGNASGTRALRVS